MPAQYILKFYVSNHTLRTQHLVNNLTSILEAVIKDNYTLNVIDVWKNPRAAEEDKILATPTLVKTSPLPAKRIIGDLSDREKVLLGLGL